VLSVKEMAALLCCSEQAVYKQVYRPALPYRKLGRKVIFLCQEVEAYLHGLPGLQLRPINPSPLGQKMKLYNSVCGAIDWLGRSHTQGSGGL